ncbi:MAG: hypothetical protein JST20_12865 [Bacteroidetes bacterium]|nr:hypothetical protein [Bacteroidota bacterium]
MKRLHGASRLGMMLPNADRGAITGIEDIFTRTLEKKSYELTDHLGNVRSVITDMKLPDGSDGFLPEATTRNYYYPFGMERPLMTASTGMQSYRYGYNGMEKDNAVSPTGVTGANYSTDFREIDTRIGRWWSRDPIVKPWESPYVTFGDNPIAFMDPSGLSQTNPNTNPNVTPPTDAGQEMDYEGSHFRSGMNQASGQIEWRTSTRPVVGESSTPSTAVAGVQYVENPSWTVGGRQFDVGDIGGFHITGRMTDDGQLYDYYATLRGEYNNNPQFLLGAEGLHALALNPDVWSYKLHMGDLIPLEARNDIFNGNNEGIFKVWKHEVINPFNWLVAGEAFVLSLPKVTVPMRLSDLTMDLLQKGFQQPTTSKGGYITFNHSDGRIVHVKPTGEVIPVKPTVSSSGKKYNERTDYDFIRLPNQSHSTNHVIDLHK